MTNPFEKKGKWVLIATYNEGGTDRIVMARKGKSGMLYFKVKTITPVFTLSYLVKSEIKTDKFESVINEII